VIKVNPDPHDFCTLLLNRGYMCNLLHAIIACNLLHAINCTCNHV